MTVLVIVMALHCKPIDGFHNMITENDLCADIFDVKQCIFLQNSFRKLLKAYDRKTKEDYNKREIVKSLFINQINQINQKVLLLEKQIISNRKTSDNNLENETLSPKKRKRRSIQPKKDLSNSDVANLFGLKYFDYDDHVRSSNVNHTLRNLDKV